VDKDTTSEIDEEWRPLNPIQAGVIERIFSSNPGLRGDFITDTSTYLARTCQACGGGCGGFELDLKPDVDITIGDAERVETMSGEARDAFGQLGLITLWIKGAQRWRLTSIDIAIADDEVATPHRWHWQESPEQLDIGMEWW